MKSVKRRQRRLREGKERSVTMLARMRRLMVVFVWTCSSVRERHRQLRCVSGSTVEGDRPKSSSFRKECVAMLPVIRMMPG
jgi:hypothetical protein